MPLPSRSSRVRLQTLLFVPIMYGLIGFKFSDGAFVYWLIMYMFSLSSFTFFGQLLVYVTPSPMLAQVQAATTLVEFAFRCPRPSPFPWLQS
jgi:hypothetical protein